MYKYFVLLLAIGILSLSTVKESYAEEEPYKKEQPVMLEAITVTAEKREESIQEVPASVSAVTAQEIRDSRTRKMEDIANYIPNLSMKAMDTTIPSIYMRGLGSLYGSTAVGVTVDGVSYLSAQMLEFELYDIERIEVLRGPQGTLYGQNTIAGVINIVTNKPTNDFHWGFEQTVGSYNSYETGMYMRGPIIEDTLYFSFAGGFDHQDSFYDNTHPVGKPKSAQDFTGRVGLRYTPTEDLDISLRVDGKNYHGPSFPFSPDSWDSYNVNVDTDSDYKKYIFGISLDIDYAAKYFDFKSISAYRSLNEMSFYDGVFTPTRDFVQDSTDDLEQFTQELRFSSNDEDSNFQWLLGFYGYQKTHDEDLDSIRFMPIPTTSFLLKNSDKNSGIAAFGEGRYTWFDKLDLTLGLRVAYDKQELDYDGFAMGLGSFKTKQDREDTVLLPKVQLAYRFTEGFMTYASIARGYKSGGYNSNTMPFTPTFTLATDGLDYAPEFVWNYELGFKSSWFDNRFIFNTSVFYMDVTDYQASQALANAAASTYAIQNAAEVEIYGVEVETKAILLPGLEFMGGFSYTEAKYKEFQYNPTTSYKGNRPAYSPTFTYNLALQYALPLIDSMQLFDKDDSLTWVSRAELNGFGDYYFEDDNVEKEPAYSIFNLQTGLETENFSLTFWVSNLFDKKYRTLWNPMDSVPALVATGGISMYGAPRTFGVTFRMDF